MTNCSLSPRATAIALTIAVLTVCTFLASAGQANAVEPKVADALQSVRLKQSELSGEIGRRIDDLIYKNFMALDLEKDFLSPFRERPYDGTKGQFYIGLGKVIDAGSMFAAYTGDAKVAQRTKQASDDVIQTRNPDGYLGVMKPEPEGRQNYRNWTLHEQEYLILGLVDHYRYCGDAASLEHARKLADYVLETFPKNPHPDTVSTAGLPEAMLTLYQCTGDRRYLRFAREARHGNCHGEVACAALSDWEQDFRDPNTSHVYVNLARCYAQTMLYRFEPNERLLTMSRRMLDEFLSTEDGKDELLIIGSGSRGEHFGRQQDGSGAVCESCATAYWIRLLDSLARLQGDLRYGDLVERAIYNALFAAQDPAGRRLRYFTSMTGQRGYFDRDGFCCPGNYRRIVAELPQMVYYRTQDGGIAVNLFTQSNKKIPLGKNRTVTIAQETEYPTAGFRENQRFSFTGDGVSAAAAHSALARQRKAGDQRRGPHRGSARRILLRDQPHLEPRRHGDSRHADAVAMGPWPQAPRRPSGVDARVQWSTASVPSTTPSC